LVIAIALILVLAGATWYVRNMYYNGLDPVTESSQKVKLVTIERGATVDDIASQLKEAGLIRSPWAFKLYVGVHNARDSLQAGTYSFSPSQSVVEIVVQLTRGKVNTDLVTIIPGQRLDQVRNTLVNYGFDEDEVDEALNPLTYEGHPALVDKPLGASLEGYIYPDSYQKDASTKPRQIVEKALAEMEQKLTPGLRDAFAEHGLSTYEAIVLASIVEKEVPKPEDRAQVAQVFLRRLSIGMKLESDATKYYFDSYKNSGLPPEPISNVNISSLKAVAEPTQTDWLYFVSGDDGTTHFSHTLEEHEAKVRQYCTELCGR
jgi:UPF0755 protein